MCKAISCLLQEISHTTKTFIFFSLELHPHGQSTSRFHKGASCANFTAKFIRASQPRNYFSLIRQQHWPLSFAFHHHYCVKKHGQFAIHVKVSSAAVRPTQIHVFCAN